MPDRTGEDMLNELYAKRIDPGVTLSDTALRLLTALGTLTVHFQKVNDKQWQFRKYTCEGKVVPPDVVNELQYYGFLSPMPMVMKKDRERRDCGISQRGKEWRDANDAL